jgi:hypothetical protein
MMLTKLNSQFDTITKPWLQPMCNSQASTDHGTTNGSEIGCGIFDMHVLVVYDL